MDTKNCISDTDLVRLWENELVPQKKTLVQQHLENCTKCMKRWEQMSAGAGYFDDLMDDNAISKLEKEYDEKGQMWWSEYVAEQIFGLLVQVPDQINDFRKILGVKASVFVRSEAVIDLPLLQPAQEHVKRLAAATGEGFAEQRLHQDEPPFDFHLVQFGEQLRINVSAPEDSPYKHCLARLELLRADVCMLSRILSVDKGEAQLVLEPKDIRPLKLSQQRISVKLMPLVTQQQLIEAGAEVYVAILTKLLEHNEPVIRCNTVKVIARILGSEAPSLIKPLANDSSEIVRAAVQKALKQFPYLTDTPEQKVDD